MSTVLTVGGNRYFGLDLALTADCTSVILVSFGEDDFIERRHDRFLDVRDFQVPDLKIDPEWFERDRASIDQIRFLAREVRLPAGEELRRDFAWRARLSPPPKYSFYQGAF